MLKRLNTSVTALEVDMKLYEDNKQAYAILERDDEYDVIQGQVAILNQDLIDSGFDQYQYIAVKKGKRVYIEKK